MKTKLMTESVTFRLDSDAVQALKKRALDERVSLSALVNHIVTDYLEWEGNRPVSNRFVVIEKHTLKSLVEATESNILKKIAAMVAKGLRDAALAVEGKSGLESALKILKLVSRRSRFSLTEHQIDGRAVYVLRHDMGKNWSDFCKEQIVTMMIDMGHPVKIETTEALLTITVLY